MKEHSAQAGRALPRTRGISAPRHPRSQRYCPRRNPPPPAEPPRTTTLRKVFAEGLCAFFPAQKSSAACLQPHIGAQGCSHGCSPRLAGVTRGRSGINQTAPAGRRTPAACTQSGTLTLPPPVPLLGHTMSSASFHEFRDAQSGIAPLVATTHGPAGAEHLQLHRNPRDLRANPPRATTLRQISAERLCAFLTRPATKRRSSRLPPKGRTTVAGDAARRPGRVNHR